MIVKVVTVPYAFGVDFFMKKMVAESELKHSGWAYYKNYDRFVSIWKNSDMYHDYHYSYSEAASYIIAEGADGGVVFNQVTGEITPVKIIEWKDRDKAKSSQEAIEFISNYLAYDFGKLNKLEEVGEYAAKHNIPFSSSLMENFVDAFNLHQPQWNSSSAFC